jgi:DnaJ-class molecular chaperone
MSDMNESVIDVCDACGGDGEFAVPRFDPIHGAYEDTVCCDHCHGEGFILRAADECDSDYIADCGNPFVAAQGEIPGA